MASSLARPDHPHPVQPEAAAAKLAVFKKYIFDDCTSAEIHCADLMEAFEIARPFRILFDKDDIVASKLTDQPAPAHEDFPAYEHGDSGLIWELLSCIKWLSRGQTELAKDYLQRLSAALQPDYRA